MDPYAWSLNPEALVGVAGVTIAYLLGLRRFPASRTRVACFLAAGALVLAVSVTPVETLALEYLLTVHLLQNVVLAEWAPALAVVGLAPALAAAAGAHRSVRAVTRPAVALTVWTANYMVWHLPWIYDLALEHRHSVLHAEHLLYFLTGAALWWPVLHDAPHRLATGRRAGYLFAAFVLASPIGLLMALLPEAAYSFYEDAPERLWGLSPLADQQLAGVTMVSEQAVVFFAAFAVYFVRFLAEQDAEPEDSRRAPRTHVK